MIDVHDTTSSTEHTRIHNVCQFSHLNVVGFVEDPGNLDEDFNDVKNETD